MLFSIITVCYNSQKTIRKTFDSVLAQTCQDYEYLVIDGVSTDGTLEIIREYEPLFKGKMRWISEKDQGIYDAMNKGIAIARGDFLNFLNSDDFYEKNTLEIVLQHANRYMNVDVFYGITRLFDDRNEVMLVRKNHTQIELLGAINHQAIWYRRNLFAVYGFYNLNYKIYADYDHLLRLKNQKVTFFPIDSIVVNFYAGGVSEMAYLQPEFIEEKNRVLLGNQVISLKEYQAKRQLQRWIMVKSFMRKCCRYFLPVEVLKKVFCLFVKR